MWAYLPSTHTVHTIPLHLQRYPLASYPHPDFIYYCLQVECESVSVKGDQDTKPTKYKFDELKFLSTSILNNLGRHLSSCNIQELPVPEGVVNVFIQGFDQLAFDTIVERREWQTDCYLDLRTPRKPLMVRELTNNSSHRRTRESGRRKNNKMAVRMERPTTAKSTASWMSIKSDVSNASSHDGREYDKLPPELRAQGPMILRYRRETQAPPSSVMPKTRLERYNSMKAKAQVERRKGY